MLLLLDSQIDVGSAGDVGPGNRASAHGPGALRLDHVLVVAVGAGMDRTVELLHAVLVDGDVDVDFVHRTRTGLMGPFHDRTADIAIGAGADTKRARLIFQVEREALLGGSLGRSHDKSGSERDGRNGRKELGFHCAGFLFCD